MHNLILYLTDNIDVEVYDIVCDIFENKDYFKNNLTKRYKHIYNSAFQAYTQITG